MAGVSVVFLAIFAYLPMFGIVLAFKDGDRQTNILRAIVYSPWCGFDNFKSFLIDPNFVNVLVNTFGLNVLTLVISFPLNIIFALLINEVKHLHYRKAVQTVSIFPHFVSWVIFAGMITSMTDMTTGIINPILEAFGLSSPENPVNIGTAEYFWAEMIIATVIKDVGWSSIIYLAAIKGISPELYEAARIDGANRWQMAVRITVPMISSTITVFLLLAISRILQNSFEQFYAFQNTLNQDRSEVIATYVYKMGISQRRYSYTTALGLFNSLISIILLVSSNWLSKKMTGKGIL